MVSRQHQMVLLDRGFIREVDRNLSLNSGSVEVKGNLLWPNEVDASFTPDPDMV